MVYLNYLLMRRWWQSKWRISRYVGSEIEAVKDLGKHRDPRTAILAIDCAEWEFGTWDWSEDCD